MHSPTKLARPRNLAPVGHYAARRLPLLPDPPGSDPTTMKHSTLLLLSSLVTPLASLSAQNATITSFGTGCTFANQTLAIGATGLPQLGTTFTIDYSGPNMNSTLSTQPLLGLGLASTNIPIPATFLPQQPPGCTQWIVPDVLLAMPATPAGPFVTQSPVTVPNDGALIGFQFTAQWAVFAVQCGIVPPCWFSALPTSDALLITVGV